MIGEEIDFGPSFTNSEIKMIEMYNSLDAHGREIVSLLLKKEYERCTASPEDPSTDNAKAAAEEVRAACENVPALSND